MGLKLTRRTGEKVVVTVPPSTTPTTVTIEVAAVKGQKVTLTFEAPKTTAIVRTELLTDERREFQEGI